MVSLVAVQEVLTTHSQSHQVAGTLSLDIHCHTVVITRNLFRDTLQHQRLIRQDDSRCDVVVELVSLWGRKR